MVCGSRYVYIYINIDILSGAYKLSYNRGGPTN